MAVDQVKMADSGTKRQLGKVKVEILLIERRSDGL
jgi:hypothetical protein